MERSTIIKCLEYVSAIIFILVLVTSELNVLPGSYLVSIYCDVFNTNEYYPVMLALLPTIVLVVPVYFIKKKLKSNSEDTDKEMKTDTSYINNKELPIWIVTISGWGSESMENAYQRMDAYKIVAKKWGINIEFSSRLGTFRSYKHAPIVAEQISTHNEKTFKIYAERFGKDWRIAFVKEVHQLLPDTEE